MRNLFRVNNIPAFIICALHFLIVYGISAVLAQDALVALPIAVLVYGTILLISVSPIGEFILRLFAGARRIQRSDWLEKINTVQNEVVARAQSRHSNLPQDIRFYYINDPLPSTFSVGRHTICITSGLLDMQVEHLKGCVAHELGHITAYDSSVTQIANVGNFFIFLLGILFQSFYAFNNWTARYTRRGVNSLLRSVLTFIPTAVIFGLLGLSRLVLNIGNRSKEYAADQFALDLGYGRELRNALLSIDFSSQTERRTLWRMLTAEHPAVHDRVGRIDSCSTEAQDPLRRRATDLYSLLNS